MSRESQFRFGEDEEKTAIMVRPPVVVDEDTLCVTHREAGLSPIVRESLSTHRATFEWPQRRWWQRRPWLWIAKLFGRRARSGPGPVQLRGRTLDHVAPLLWEGTSDELVAITEVLARVRVAKMRGPGVFLEERILFFLERAEVAEDGSIGLAAVRAYVLDAYREDVDRALLHLEAKGRIDLLPPVAPASGVRRGAPVGACIDHPTRGPLERCIPITPKRAGVVS